MKSTEELNMLGGICLDNILILSTNDIEPNIKKLQRLRL